MWLGQTMLLEGLVAVGHVQGRLLEDSLAFIADPEEISDYKFCCLGTDEDGLGFQSMESSI